jgi:hypothetical protein
VRRSAVRRARPGHRCPARQQQVVEVVSDATGGMADGLVSAGARPAARLQRA